MTHYIDGFLLPIAPEKIAEYQKMASLAGSVWKENEEWRKTHKC